MILETSERRASKRTESVLFVLWYSDLARIAQAVPNGCSWSSAPSPQSNQNDFRGSIRLDFPRVMSPTASPHTRINPDSSPCHLRSGPSFPLQHHLLSRLLRCSSLDILRCVFPKYPPGLPPQDLCTLNCCLWPESPLLEVSKSALFLFFQPYLKCSILSETFASHAVRLDLPEQSVSYFHHGFLHYFCCFIYTHTCIHVYTLLCLSH